MAISESVSLRKKRRRKKMSAKDVVFYTILYAFFLLFVVVTVYPLIRILLYSLTNSYDMPYVVIFHLPRELTFINYGLFFDNDAFRHGLVISVLRVLIGTFAGTMCSSLLAFILSRKKFIFKKGLAVFWIITMYAQAGLVTTMLLYKKLYNFLKIHKLLSYHTPIFSL